MLRFQFTITYLSKKHGNYHVFEDNGKTGLNRWILSFVSCPLFNLSHIDICLTLKNKSSFMNAYLEHHFVKYFIYTFPYYKSTLKNVWAISHYLFTLSFLVNDYECNLFNKPENLFDERKNCMSSFQFSMQSHTSFGYFLKDYHNHQELLQGHTYQKENVVPKGEKCVK